MRMPALLVERHIDHRNAINHLDQTTIVAIDLRLEEDALHLLVETRILQQQIDDVHEAPYTGVGMEAATEEDQGPQRGHIRLEEIHAPGHPSPERVATLNLPCLERDHHLLRREKHHHTAERGRPLEEKGYLHRPERDTRDASFPLPEIRVPDSRTRVFTVIPNALLLHHDALSTPLASPPRFLLVAHHRMFIQTG